MSLLYTHIYHNFRKENKLTCNEYVICDMVYHLSVNPDAKVKGWCFMSRETMADEIGISKQSVINLLNKMIEIGFLEKDEVTKFVKTTKKWNVVYFSNGKESLPSSKESLPETSKESLPIDGKESLPNSNNSLYSNNSNKNKDINESLFLSELDILIDVFNDTMGTRIKNTGAVLQNYIYWRKYYEPKEIEFAIRKINHHDFWKNRMTFETFFRQKNTAKEPVNYISDMLNFKESGVKADMNNAFKESFDKIWNE